MSPECKCSLFLLNIWVLDSPHCLLSDYLETKQQIPEITDFFRFCFAAITFRLFLANWCFDSTSWVLTFSTYIALLYTFSKILVASYQDLWQNYSNSWPVCVVLTEVERNYWPFSPTFHSFTKHSGISFVIAVFSLFLTNWELPFFPLF